MRGVRTTRHIRHKDIHIVYFPKIIHLIITAIDADQIDPTNVLLSHITLATKQNIWLIITP